MRFIVIFLQQRLTHPHPLKSGVGIARIVEPPLPLHPQEIANGLPLNPEERPQNPDLPIIKHGISHAGQSRRLFRGTSLAHGDGFRLIVGGMGGDDARGAEFGSGITKQSITRPTGCSLYAGGGFVAQPLLDYMGHTQTDAERAHILRLIKGTFAQAVIHRAGGKAEAFKAATIKHLLQC